MTKYTHLVKVLIYIYIYICNQCHWPPIDKLLLYEVDIVVFMLCCNFFLKLILNDTVVFFFFNPKFIANLKYMRYFKFILYQIF